MVNPYDPNQQQQPNQSYPPQQQPPYQQQQPYQQDQQPLYPAPPYQQPTSTSLMARLREINVGILIAAGLFLSLCLIGACVILFGLIRGRPIPAPTCAFSIASCSRSRRAWRASCRCLTG